MAQEIKTVMILGGRGSLGAYLVLSLLKAGFKVTILSRGSPGASPTTGNAPVVQTDYTFASLVNAFHGQDAVVSAIPTHDFEEQKKIVDAALAAKVKRILPNEFGVDSQAGEGLGEMGSFFKNRQEVVAYVREKQDEGLSWTAVCTGSWIDWILVEGQGLLGFDLKNNRGTAVESGEQKFNATTVAKVGEAVAAVLVHSAETENQYVHVNSFNLTQNIVWEAIERISGNKLIADKMTVAEILAVGKKHLDEDDWDGAYYKLVTALVYSDTEAIYFPEKAEHWNKVLGLSQEESVDEMIGRVLAKVSSLKSST